MSQPLYWKEKSPQYPLQRRLHTKNFNLADGIFIHFNILMHLMQQNKINLNGQQQH
jgi:hypothetical protein